MSFIIVGKEQPVYELDMSGRREDVARMAQYVLHASLDMVDVNVWTTNATYLKVVDRFNEQMVSAYVTPGGARLLLLHESRNEEGIKAFFTEAHELYIKLLLNPFYAPNSRIDNREFDSKVRQLARRFLGFKGEV